MNISVPYSLKFFLFWLAAESIFFVPAAFSAADNGENMEDKMNKTALLAETDTIAQMLQHPALMDFGVHLLPRQQDKQSDLLLRDVGRLMLRHSHVQPQIVVQAVNRLITDSLAGKKVFYSFYEEQAKKIQTGLFYFRRKKDAPFALICPGGDFVYVGSLHEGFPQQ